MCGLHKDEEQALGKHTSVGEVEVEDTFDEFN